MRLILKWMANTAPEWRLLAHKLTLVPEFATNQQVSIP